MKIYCTKDFTLSYITKGNRKNQTIVLIPPGVGQVSYYKDLINTLSKKYFIVPIDLPGAGKSLCKEKDNNVKGISENIASFLKKTNIKKPIIIGLSYGGNIAVHISSKIRLKSLVLIATGEYFNFLIKILLSIIFSPALYSRKIRRIYAIIYIKLGIQKFPDCKGKQLKSICQRWYDIIWYRLPSDYKSSVRTLIIKSNRDKTVKKSSYTKLEKIFVNNEIIDLNCSHRCKDYLNTLKKNNYKEIIDFIDSS